MATYRTFRTWLTIRALPKGRGWRVTVRAPGANIIPTYKALSCSKEEAAKGVYEQWKKDHAKEAEGIRSV